MAVRRLELMALAAIKEAKRNPKQHDVAYLAAGISDSGLVDVPILDERTGRLIAGHGRLKTLRALFEKDAKHPPDGVEVVFGKGGAPSWNVPIVRGWSSRDDDHASAILVALNRGPERGGWNVPDLAELVRGLSPTAIELSGFSLDSLDDLLGSSAKEKLARNLDDETHVPSGDAVKVRAGDVWALGEHVLVCGRSPDAIVRLLGKRKAVAVATDPPYGIDIVGGDRAVGGGGLAKANRYEKVAGDDHPFDPAPYLSLAKKVVLWGGNHYADKLPPSPAWLVWDKRDGMPSNDFADVELAWSNLKAPARLFRHRWSGMLKASERGERRQHPTQKPVALFEWVFGLCSKRGELVLDPFLGSGSSLLAGETTGRQVIGAELVPAYCQVTINRWEALTKKKAGLLERGREKGKGKR